MTAEIVWKIAQHDLGLKMVFGAVLPNLEHLGPMEVLIECFGAPRGMIISSDAEKLWLNRDDILESGYGYAALDLKGPYNKDEIVSLLRDWTWTCCDIPPSWYTE